MGIRLRSLLSRKRLISRASIDGVAMPVTCVAASTTVSRRALMLSRCDSTSSRSIEPTTVRMLVKARLRIA